MDNLVEPLTFDTWTEAQDYARRHYCAFCQNILIPGYKDKKNWKSSKLTVYCTEHGIMYEHTVTSKRKAQHIEVEKWKGAGELREHPEPRNEKDILADLGY
jgi:hypothetical protein